LRTLSTVAAGSEDVDRTRDNELTDVSPELVGSTALNDCWYMAGTVASAKSPSYESFKPRDAEPVSYRGHVYVWVYYVPIALVKMDGTWPGGGEGDGAALQGSRPS
jgi:hypothetical protein